MAISSRLKSRDPIEAAGGCYRVGSILTLFFAPEPPRDYASAKKSDTARYAAFFREMLDRGVYLPPSQFEAMFLSTAHTAEDLQGIADSGRTALSLAGRY